MSYMPASITCNKRAAIAALALTLWLVALTAFGQAQQSTDVRELPPNQTLEREMTGAETHRYKFDLQANEFFQVRVEQKGVDVALKLLDADGNPLATMDSPNGKEGFETLSLVADKAGNFILEVSGFDAKAGKGIYTIKREASRTATANDRRRVEVEKLFIEAMTARDIKGQSEVSLAKFEAALAGWRELGDNYLIDLTVQMVRENINSIRNTKASSLFDDALKLSDQKTTESRQSALAKFDEARKLFKEVNNKRFEALSLLFSGKTTDALGNKQKALEFYQQALLLFRQIGDKEFEGVTQANIGQVFFALGENQKALEILQQALLLGKEANNKSVEAGALRTISHIYHATGEYQKALDVSQQALLLFRQVNDKQGESDSLNNIGQSYSDLGNKQKALDYLNQSLLIGKQLGNKAGEAYTLNNIGIIYTALGENQRALEYLNQSLTIVREVGNKKLEADLIHNISIVYSQLGEMTKALEYLDQALTISRQDGNKHGEAIVLGSLGQVYAELGDKRKSIDYLNQALPILRAIGHKAYEASALNRIGQIYFDFGESQTALEYYNQALPIYRQMGNKSGEAETLTNIGRAYSYLGKKTDAIDYYNQALPLFKQIENKTGEAATLNRIGSDYADSGEKKKALEYYNQALEISRQVGDKVLEPTTLSRLGDVYSDLGEITKALEYYNQALTIRKQTANKLGEAISLNRIGDVYADLGERAKAIEYYNQSLAIRKQIGDKNGEAVTLNNIGDVYSALRQIRKAIEYYNQSLAIRKQIDDKEGEAISLNKIGGAYLYLFDNAKTLEYYNQSLALRRQIGDKEGEAITLNKIGELYLFLSSDKRKALDYLSQSLTIRQQIGDKEGEGITLYNIGEVYSRLGEETKAIEYYNRSLAIRRQTGDKRGEAYTLTRTGLNYRYSATDKLKALDYYNQALTIFNQIGDKEGEAITMDFLMEVCKLLENPRLAIFYGKQSVNKYQELRQAIQSLDKEIQKNYLRTIGYTYRKLSDILIAEGRIIEAEQVLAMLKQEEVFDYLRRDASEADNLQLRADLKPEERDALKRYNEIADKIATLGVEFGTLQELQSKGIKLSVEQDKRYTELSTQIEAASRSFQVFLRQLAEEFARRTNTEKDLQENLALQADLKSWGEGLVFLYTLAGEDRYRVILVTPDTQVDGKTEIKATELNDKITKFRAAVQDPTGNPRRLGKELYDILIKPVEKQLDGAKAKTLLWSLDGNLRLLPLAALWDGTQYFGQKYQNVTITLASRTRLGDKVEPNWRALGLGVSEARKVKEPNGTREFSFGSLPAVRDELCSIVQSEQSPNGVMPGQSLLDADFNENALESQLLRGYKVVHIASHFSLNPGDSTRSFLLLGDGNVLTVDNMKNNPKLSFRGVELLTLSACQTAVVEKDSSGKEIEGFGYVAQQKGAKAILATLWSVADESTQLLMSEFYRLRKENPQLTKAAALQLAQQEMIEGKLKSTQTKGAPRDTSEANVALPDYSHPYYWSPFVLIGNWR